MFGGLLGFGRLRLFGERDRGGGEEAEEERRVESAVDGVECFSQRLAFALKVGSVFLRALS